MQKETSINFRIGAKIKSAACELLQNEKDTFENLSTLCRAALIRLLREKGYLEQKRRRPLNE